MTIEITNNGASIKINDTTAIRNIMKSQIQEIVVVKTNIIKIDIGKGALYNVFIPYADVTIPSTANPEALKDKLTTLNATADTIKNAVNALDSKIFFEPVMVDESNPNLIYKGFASPAANGQDAVWAIQRVSIANEICSYQWADGNKNFDNVWNNRAALLYS